MQMNTHFKNTAVAMVCLVYTVAASNLFLRIRPVGLNLTVRAAKVESGSGFKGAKNAQA